MGCECVGGCLSVCRGLWCVYVRCKAKNEHLGGQHGKRDDAQAAQTHAHRSHPLISRRGVNIWELSGTRHPSAAATLDTPLVATGRIHAAGLSYSSK